ncbi:hypothetical protein AVEN_117709-1 [Araneus ventricosus]|uniref:Uncharacterized protein n=1 Tax=Araneus ventricosus TaxID=182803 RepID=A0A4Y2KRW0_ARAVE|nr:hypothetical protein AVEN_117709-1 [Araneus ventricosus]
MNRGVLGSLPNFIALISHPDLFFNFARGIIFNEFSPGSRLPVGCHDFCSNSFDFRVDVICATGGGGSSQFAELDSATDKQALRFLHNNPHRAAHTVHFPALPGMFLSSEMGPKNHTTIFVPSREARTCLLIRELLIHELSVPPPQMGN